MVVKNGGLNSVNLITLLCGVNKVKSAPIGTTHFYEKNNNFWFYKREGGKLFYPDEKNQWVEHIFGGDVNHDKWLKDNLIGYDKRHQNT